VETIPDTELDHPAQGGKKVLTDLLLGIASHDLYHAGQIQLLKRLRQGGSHPDWLTPIDLGRVWRPFFPHLLDRRLESGI